MMCGKPITLDFAKGGRPARVAPCGQCLACRINNRRKKAARFLLEAKFNAPSAFVTLTFDEENFPWAVGSDYGHGTVSPHELRKFVRRVRREHPGLRWVGVGEYGEESGRPHYHLIYFGCSVRDARVLSRDNWKKGFITVSELNHYRAQYTAGYTAKKLTRADDGRLKVGQHPEFMRQTLKPPIGFAALDYLEELHYTRSGSLVIEQNDDTAKQVRIDGKIWPLDRTMRKHLRQRLGRVARSFPEFGMEAPEREEQEQAERVLAKMERKEIKRSRVL